MANATRFLKPFGYVGAGVGGAALGAAGGYALGTRKSKKKRKRSKRSYSYTRKRRTRKTPRTAGKRRDTSHKRIRYTKKGQPYVIMASGKARFIKKKGARRSHKRKGGKY